MDGAGARRPGDFVAFPLQFGLLPVFAREVFHVGAAGLGLLGTALGVGAVLGSVLMAWSGAMHHAASSCSGRRLPARLRVCVHPGVPMALGVLVLMGIAAQTVALTNMTVLLLSTTSSAMRGRIMGLRRVTS